MTYPEHRQKEGACLYPHISPLVDREVPSYGLSICERGELVEVKSNVPRRRQGGGIRGNVISFSRSSRLNGKKRLAVADSDSKPHLCTLTYPDNFPADPVRWAKDLDNFLKRLKRRFPNAGVFWVREMQYRKSGSNKGCLAPHFHLLLWGANYWAARDFFPTAWYEVVGSGDERHLAAGTQVLLSRSVRAVKGYSAKYITKAESKNVQDAYPDGTGRWWGTRGTIPKSPLKIAYLTDRQRDQFARTIRRYIKSRIGRNPYRFSHYGASVFMEEPDDWVRYAEMIGAVFRDE